MSISDGAGVCRNNPEGLCFFYQAEIESIRSVNGSVVTRLHLGYGMIDDAVRFSRAEVLGGVPLQPGDRVNYTAIRDGPQGGWKALRVRMLSSITQPLSNHACWCLSIDVGTCGVVHMLNVAMVRDSGNIKKCKSIKDMSQCDFQSSFSTWIKNA